MAELFQFDPAAHARRPECLACEDMLTDAVDGLLSGADQTFFDRHIVTCAGCSALLAEAQRGAAWLDLLKAPRPEPSAELFTRILAATSQVALLESAPGAAIGLPIPPVAIAARIVPFRPNLPQLGRYMLDPRLAMTAAMAFFSIALTLSMAGMRLDQLHARNLNPAGLKRSYYQATATAARRYESLRVVHVLESRADDLRDNLRDETLDDLQDQRPSKSRPSMSASQQPADKARQPAEDAPKPRQNPDDPHGISRNHTPTPASPQATPHLLLTGLASSKSVPSSRTGGLA